MSSTEDVRMALVGMVRDSTSAQYDALYEATMRRIESQPPDQTSLAKQVLSYMLCARCPWTAAELCHALTVKAGEPELDWDAMPSLQPIISACPGMLVTIGSDERDHHQDIENLDDNDNNAKAAMARLDRIAAVLVHRTAHEYLQRTSEQWLPEADKQMAATCLAYLSLRYFSDQLCDDKSELESRLQIFPLYFYAALHWGFHARIAFDKFPDMASMEFEFPSSSALIQASCDVMFKVGHWPRDDRYYGDYPTGMSGLHVAAYFGIVNLIRALGSRAETMINALDDWGCTALTWAAGKGQEGAVETILKFPAIDVDIRDSQGRTPISLAAEHGHIAIVKMLLDHDANPNFKDFHQATPLWYAAKGGHINTATLLTRYDVDVNVASSAAYIEHMHTPLSLAVVNGQDEMVRLLLAQPSIQPRAKIMPSNPRFEKPFTLLWLAVKNGHSAAVEMLLSKPEIAAAARTGEDGRMLLHLAVRHGHEETVRLLLDNGVDVNAQGDGGQTALHLALQGLERAHDGIATLLLSQASVMPDLMDNNKNTPASLAVRHGRIGILRLLLAKGVNTETRTGNGLTLLGVAAEQGYLPIVELLLATDGVDADLRDFTGLTPLSLAACPFRNRLNRGSSSECVQDHCGVIKCLLDSGHVDINSPDEFGRTPLMCAVEGHEDDISCFRALLDYEGVEIDAMDDEEQTALSLAIVEHDQDKVALLLQRGADLNLVQSYEGETLLSHAARGGMVELVRELISHYGVDVDKRNDDGHTALCEAAAENKVEVVEVLLDAGGTDLNGRCSHGQTPLHHAANTPEGEEVASFLLAKGSPDIDTYDASGRTPLHYAAESGSEALVSLLLDAGVANPNCRSRQGRTALSLAAERGQLHIVEKLLSFKGVMPDVKDGTGRTPLSWAIQSKASAVVKRLLSAAGVDLDAEDERGWTPLCWAVQDSKASDVVELLIREGPKRIDINHEDRKGRTPLALALEKGYEVIVGQLRAAGAREKGLNEYHISLDNGAEGTAYERRDEDSDGDSRSSMPREDSSQGHMGHSYWKWEEAERKRERAQRERERARWKRWLDSNWFDDAAPDGDGDSNNSDWSGTNDSDYRRSEFRSTETQIETQIELGAQKEVISGDEGKEAELCTRCKAFDLDQLFSRSRPDESRTIARLGIVDESWESRPCPMCKLLAAVRPRGDDEGCALYAYSSTDMWLSSRSTAVQRLRQTKATKRYFLSNWIDTVILGVGFSDMDPASKLRRQRRQLAGWDPEPYGFICRIGSNDSPRLRSLTVHQLQADQADFGRARDWIVSCEKHHGKRCNPSTSRPITSFRLIDCMTRDVVDGQSAMDQFVALSYVWGPLARKPATVDDVRVENAERVVEDAIWATQALGYRYLWVDRHCITNEDEDVRKRQLLEMNAVYANAQVTIVAAAGEDSAFGLPGVSRSRYQPFARIQGHALVAVPPEPAKVIKDSTWWTRGWTFQEGVLSRRRLIFTEYEVSYECRGMVARECVEMPERIHRVAATRYPIHEEARIFPRGSYGRYDRHRLPIWEQIEEYTKRHLTHEYDILNAMLGIMEVAAERKVPVSHLCGVPMTITRPSQTLLEAFVTCLCWRVRGGTRREAFPSWSWTGWKGKIWGPAVFGISCKLGFAIEVSMVRRDDPSGALPWAKFEAMGPKEKAALPQDYILEITGTAVDVSIRAKNLFSSHAIIHNGDVALKGYVDLCIDPEQDAEFRRRLADERVTAVAIGNDSDYYRSLLLLAIVKKGDYWERIGVIRTEDTRVMDVHGGGFRKQTFLIR